MASSRNLTKRAVEAAKPLAKDYFIWCGKTPGFGVRVYPSGKKVFVAQVRVGRTIRRVRLGVFGPLTVEEGRERAEKVIGIASDGRDPQREKREYREAITVRELCEQYMDAARAGLVVVRRFKRPKRPSTIAIDEGRIARHIVPLIGPIRARDLRRADVQQMHDGIAAGKTAGTFNGKPRGRAVVTGGAGTAARVTELLGGIFTWAEARGYVPGSNPVRGVERTRGEPKTRVLDEGKGELRALGQVLEAAQTEDDEKSRKRAERMAAKRGEKVEQTLLLPAHPAVAVARLTALSGWRRGEWSTLQWSDIDWSGHCIRRDTKNGFWTRPIGEPVLRYLRRLEKTKTSSKWVIPNRSGTGGADVKKKVAKLFDAAGLPDARSHDLRRTFSTIGDDLGYSEATIGMLIGDSPRGVIRKHYIHKPDAALVAAADRISARIETALDGEPTAEVFDLAERRLAG